MIKALGLQKWSKEMEAKMKEFLLTKYRNRYWYLRVCNVQEKKRKIKRKKKRLGKGRAWFVKVTED